MEARKTLAKKPLPPLPNCKETHRGTHIKIRAPKQAISDGSLLHPILCDGWGKTHFQVSSDAPILTTLEQHLKGREDAVSKKLAERLKDPLEVAKKGWKTTLIKEKIDKAFSTQKKLLIPGGWKGHTVYYEVIPVDEKTCRLRLYDLASPEPHTETLSTTRTQVQPYIEWHGIKKEKLISLNTLQAFQEVKLFGGSREALYLVLKDILEAKESEEKANTPAQTKKIQKDSNSPFRSLTGVLLETIRDTVSEEESLATYKRFIFEWRLELLYASIAKPNPKLTVPHWRMLCHSVEKLSRTAQKLYEQGLIDQEDLTAAHAILRKGTQWLEHHEPIVEERFPWLMRASQTFSEWLGKANERQISSWKFRSLSAPITPSNNLHQRLQTPALSPFMATIEAQSLDSKNLKKSLQTIAEKGDEAWKQKDIVSLHEGLEVFIQKLPADPRIWSECLGLKPDDDLKNLSAERKKKMTESVDQIAESLTKIASQYFNSCLSLAENGQSDPEWNVNFFKLFQLEWALILKRFEAENWIDTNKAFTFDLNPVINNWHGTFTHKQAYEQMQSWKQSELSNLPELRWDINHSHRIPFFYTLNDNQNDPEKIWKRGYGQLLSENPEIEQAIREKQGIFDRLLLSLFTPSAPKKILQAWTSEHLPSPFKPMRDMHLMGLYFTTYFFTKPVEGGSPNFFLLYLNQVNASQVFWDVGSLNPNRYPNVIAEERYHFHYPAQQRDLYKFWHRPVTEWETKTLHSCLPQNPLTTEKKLIETDRWGLTKISQVRTRFSVFDQSVHDRVHVNEHTKELAHLFLYPETQVMETLAFFTKNSHLLSKPDYQTLFHMGLFSLGALKKADEADHDLLIRTIETFFETQLKFFDEQRDIPTYLFLYRQLNYLKSWEVSSQYSFEKHREAIRTILNRQQLTSDERGLLWTELAVTYADDPTFHTDEDRLVEFFTALVHMRDYPIPKEWRDNEQQKAIRQALFRHGHHFQEIFSGNRAEAIVKRIVTPFFSEEEGNDWTWTAAHKQGHQPIFRSKKGEAVFSPFGGRLSQPNRETYLPIRFTTNTTFQTLFPTINRGIYQHGESYTFTVEGKETRVEIRNDKLLVEQKRADGWYRFVEAEEWTQKAPSFTHQHLPDHLVKNYQHWQNLKTKTVHLIDVKTDQTHYEVRLSFRNGIRQIIDTSSQRRLRKTQTLFKQFAELNSVLEWVDTSGTLKKVELPNYRLSFTVDEAHSNRLIWEQDPNFYLDLQAPKTHPHYTFKNLRHFDHFLVLKHRNNPLECRIMMPHQEFALKEAVYERMKGDALTTRYRCRTEMKQDTTHVYTVNEQGELQSETTAGHLYLALVYALMRQDRCAAHQLKKYGTKLSSYSELEHAILGQLIHISTINHSTHPNTNALSLYASFLSARNHIENDVTPYLEPKFYIRYLQTFRKNTALRLSEDEERLILAHMVHPASHPLTTSRFEELFQKKLTLQTPTPQSTQRKLDYFYVHSHKDSMVPPHTRVTMTQPYGLTSHFLYYYQLCKHGAEMDKEWLHHTLLFSLYNENNTSVATLLACLKDPERFPEIHQQFTDDTRREWEHQVETQAKAVLANRSLLTYPNQKHHDHIPSPLIPKEKPEHVPPVSFPSSFTTKTSWKQTAEPFFERNDTDNQETLDALAAHYANYPHSTEFQRLAKDLEHHKRQTESTWKISHEKLKKLRAHLLAERGVKKGLEEARQQILKQANRMHSQPLEKLLDELKEFANGTNKVTEESLGMLFARKDIHQLLACNQHLTTEEIEAILTDFGNYLCQVLHEQQKQRALPLIEKMLEMGEAAADYAPLAEQLSKELFASFDAALPPAYLMMQKISNLLIRPEQVESVKTLHESNQNTIIEKIMGSGKSRILTPLLLFLRADTKQLPLMVVPETLYEDIGHDVRRTLIDTFGMQLRPLSFQRDTSLDPKHLSSLLQLLQQTTTNKECVIMTSKSIASMVLKQIELNCKPNRTAEELKALGYLNQIVKMLSQESFANLDEVDTLLNVLHKFTFSFGKKETASRELEVNVIHHLYHLLYTNLELQKIARLDSDPHADPKVKLLTERRYHNKLKTKLLDKFLDSMSLWEQNRKILSVREHPLLRAYLLRDKNQQQQAQAFFSTLPDEAKNFYALVGEQIHSHLPHTLTRNYNERYGFSSDDKEVFAIPYSAANTPTKGSYFAHDHITMNYTFQTYMKRGVTKEIVQKKWEQLKRSAIQEMREEGTGDVTSTRAWRQWSKLTDLPLLHMRESELKQLTEAINEDAEMKLSLVANLIFYEIDSYPGQLSFSPHNLSTLFTRVTGFSGTVWNAKSYSTNLSVQKEDGIDSKTLSLLWKNSREHVTIIESEDSETMLKSCFKQPFTMITDAGGYFKEGDNQQIAETMASQANQPVAYYTETGQEMIVETDGTHHRSHEKPLPPEKRLTFLGQRDITGRNIKQPIQAVALMTIGERMLLRDLLQAAWRLRGLGQGQKVHFLINTDVAKLIRQANHLKQEESIRFDHILTFVTLNQEKQQKKDNLAALKQGLKAIPQMILLRASWENQHVDEWRPLLKQYWQEENNRTPNELYGQLPGEIEASTYLEEQQTATKHSIDKLAGEAPHIFTPEVCLKAKAEIDALIEKMKGHLEKKVQATASTNHDQAIEVEREVEQEKQQDIDQIESHAFGDAVLSEETRPILFHPLTDCTDVDNDTVKTLFPQIEISHNVFHTYFSSDKKLFGPRRTPLNFLWIDQQTKMLKLLTLQDAIHLRKEGKKIVHIEFATAEIQRDTSLTEEEKNNLIRGVALCKFLNGDFSFTNQEFPLLKAWLKTNPKELKTFYEQKILSPSYLKRAAYATSTLEHQLIQMTQ
ncbi:MAG: DUF3638 domain-containing protein [Chlamydiia bacterium]|nr:DUF3638 domain-containing protein [Chlamydiia bacterium]